MQKKIVAIILLFFYSYSPAMAFNLVIGANYGYVNINDPKYRDFKPSSFSTSMNAGISEKIGEKYIFSIQTNRFLNKSLKKHVVNNGGVSFDSKTRIISDSLFAGYLIGRFSPGIIIANTAVNKKLYYKNKMIGNQKNHAILFGVSVGYFLTKNINTSISYIAPNSELNMEGASFININYFF